jgi:hypothetical protein
MHDDIDEEYTDNVTNDCQFCASALAERDEARKLAMELLGWKTGAMPILMRYDDIAETVPGDLGSSKVENLANELARLRAANAKLLAVCERALPIVERYGSSALLADMESVIADMENTIANARGGKAAS